MPFRNTPIMASNMAEVFMVDAYLAAREGVEVITLQESIWAPVESME